MPETGCPAFTLAGKASVVAKSAAAVTVVATVDVGVGLLLMTPEGAMIAAVLVMLAVPAVPLTTKVTVPPFGKVGMAMPAPCRLATVNWAMAGQAAPPVAPVQATPATLKLATAGSCTKAPAALSGLRADHERIGERCARVDARRSALRYREIGAVGGIGEQAADGIAVLQAGKGVAGGGRLLGSTVVELPVAWLVQVRDTA